MDIDVTDEIRRTLAWMIADMNYRRAQTGMEAAPLSPEMQKATWLLGELAAGKIRCTRLL